MNENSNPNKPSPRRHIPALAPEALSAALQKLDALPIPAAAKIQLRAMLTAASNPNNERADVVLMTLEPERQEEAVAAMRGLQFTFTGATDRGRERLNAMSEAEWEQLVDDA